MMFKDVTDEGLRVVFNHMVNEMIARRAGSKTIYFSGRLKIEEELKVRLESMVDQYLSGESLPYKEVV